ncbi:CinA family protein [Hyphomicrobium sp. CS1GBMeth3]|uniref:CinA family protein n=1 Tax=Hyphomicrobium sp. CS1GBMeth3 TaxID=1892845 RepID=UPI000931F2B6|nr:CinA family protein [Hyphomicrobium sp. CS1GBMeth3]
MSSKLEKKAAAVIKRAEDKGLAIVTAESCTAGALATLLADAPGAGTCFYGGFVTYTKTCKSALLAIPPALIAQHTAVSREVALRMAVSALKASGAHVAVAVTGVIGPEPDEDGNPVGLMHIAATTRGGHTRHVKIASRKTSREANRERALAEALTLLDEILAG